MTIDYFSCCVFAAAATTGDRQIRLDFTKGLGPAINDFADLTIANGSADAHVHEGAR